jgi:hypothetical protein
LKLADVTQATAGQPKYESSNSGRAESMVCHSREYSGGYSTRGVKLTTHIQENKLNKRRTLWANTNKDTKSQTKKKETIRNQITPKEYPKLPQQKKKNK